MVQLIHCSDNSWVNADHIIVLRIVMRGMQWGVVADVTSRPGSDYLLHEFPSRDGAEWYLGKLVEKLDSCPS